MSAVQLLPSPLATYLDMLPPATVNEPPAYTSLPDTASASATLSIAEDTGLRLGEDFGV